MAQSTNMLPWIGSRCTALFFTLVLALAFSSHPISACPDFCTCEEKVVTCTDFKTMDLTFLPPDADTLVLSQGEMEEVPPAFFARASNLRVVELVSFNARVVRGGAFRGLKYLKVLSLTQSSFDIVEPDAFSGIHFISSFTISDCHFGRVGKHAFAEIAGVDHWRIWKTKFTTISDEAFFGLKDIHTLQIYQNNISYIGKDIFAGSDRMDYINFYMNYIKTLSKGSLKRAKEAAERLVVHANTFECSCDIAWMEGDAHFQDYLSSNECVYPGSANPLESTFRLADVSMKVLCPTTPSSSTASFSTEPSTSGVLHTLQPIVVVGEVEDELTSDSANVTSEEAYSTPETPTIESISSVPTATHSSSQPEYEMESTSENILFPSAKEASSQINNVHSTEKTAFQTTNTTETMPSVPELSSLVSSSSPPPSSSSSPSLSSSPLFASSSLPPSSSFIMPSTDESYSSSSLLPPSSSTLISKLMETHSIHLVSSSFPLEASDSSSTSSSSSASSSSFTSDSSSSPSSSSSSHQSSKSTTFTLETDSTITHNDLPQTSNSLEQQSTTILGDKSEKMSASASSSSSSSLSSSSSSDTSSTSTDHHPPSSDNTDSPQPQTSQGEGDAVTEGINTITKTSTKEMPDSESTPEEARLAPVISENNKQRQVQGHIPRPHGTSAAIGMETTTPSGAMSGFKVCNISLVMLSCFICWLTSGILKISTHS